MDRLPGDNSTINRSPLRTVGSKAKLIQKHRLWEFFPACKNTTEHDSKGRQLSYRKVYVELFSGSVLLFWNLRPPPIYAIINDSNHEIFNFFSVIKDKYDEFIKELEWCYCGNDWLEKYSAMEGDVAKAIAFYIANRMDNIIPIPIVFPKDFSLWKARLDQCRCHVWNYNYDIALERLNTVQFEEHSNTTEFIVYEDPPYVGTENFYKGMFGKEDHRKLAKINHESTHRIILSYNDCDVVRDLYSDWNVLELESYSGMTKKPMAELLLSNKPLERHTAEKVRNGKAW